jgi:hemerythrin-like metal-binding protein
MTDFYIWTEAELGLHIHEMDSEHQELIKRMNALYASATKKAPVTELQSRIDDLASYTVKHFADEEAYMAKIGFAGLATHKLIHEQLLSQFNSFVEEFKKNGAVSEKFFNFLKVWLTSHIRGIDMKYSDFKLGKKAG